jgi:hypothetical protein
LCLYVNEPLKKWFIDEYAKADTGKLDMGKSCLRFKNVHKIPYSLIGSLCRKITPEEWIAIYEKSLKSNP